MKTKDVLVLALFLLPFRSLILSAQEIKGRVYAADENKPLIGATMRVLTEDSVYVTGFTTDEKGRFRSDIKLDNFWLEISYVGYEKNVVLVQNSDRKNYNPQIQISAVSGTKRSIFRQKNKTKRSKKGCTQHL